MRHLSALSLYPFLCAALFLVRTNCPGKEFYCSPSGTPQAPGSKARPWDLSTALSSASAVGPGDTIWLLPGVYRGNFKSSLTGTAEKPITLRGEREGAAQIDGLGEHYPLTIQGAHAIYRDFEIIQSSTWKPQAETPVAVQCVAPHIKLINLVIHDAGQGIGAWMAAHDLEVYGCLIYYNGIRPLEHGIYTQNDASTGAKRFVDNIIFNNAGFGIHAYTKGGQLSGFQFIGNVLFNNGAKRGPGEELDNLFVGGAPPADQIVARENCAVFTGETRRNNIRFSYQDHQDNPHGALLAADNLIIGGTSFVAEDWRKITFTNNTLASSTTLIQTRPPPGVSHSDYIWNFNHYFGAAAFSNNRRLQHFSEWVRLTGLDEQSQYTQDIPQTARVIVRPNRYESNRATIVVVNWPYSNNVPVRLDQVLRAGAPFEIRNAQDFFGAPVLTDVFDGQLVLLPMTNLSAAIPKGPAPLPQPTGPFFNVFILRERP